MAGSAFRLAVSAEDGFGNVAPAFAGTVTVGLPGGALAPSQPAVAGVATFSRLALDQAGTGATLTAASPGLSAAASTPLIVSPAPAVQLVVTAQPPVSVTAGAGFGLTVAAEDAFGNIDPSYGGGVTIALPSYPGGAVLGGRLTVAAVAGVAAFAGLSLARAAPGNLLQASGSGLNGTTTTRPIAVAPAAAAQLAIVTEPPSPVTAGTAFGLVVAAEDPFGNVDPTYGGTVSLALTNASPSASLGGTLTVPAAGGIATFTGLSLDAAASGATLQATSGGLAGALTGTIAVIPPPTSVLGVSLETVTAGKHRTGTLIVVQFDNPLSAATAQNLAAYSLATLPQGKTHPSKRLALSQASYNGSAHTVTLRPAKKLVLNPPLQLRISASALTDPLGRPLGGDFLATLSKSGVTTARSALAAASVDALIAAGFRPRLHRAGP
jgi:hypothetical protein